ncbi:MgtC/SapB family protein [Gemmata sp. JC673]|uniref:Protein MgtC n=1 Tax=Gemmata algarum TaxID=2975278 RepID=A0ABU5F7E8_9BACT|nr:MgtC/SapB family protein [Gemmata algarum]MDY3563409.1 MgtC/SapB family protein [Gemmata algarum]
MELLNFTGNIALAALLGVVIGAERQLRRHPAGLRTNALVSTGAALFVSLTQLLGDHNSPSRIASYIVSGVGFLGGGVILKDGTTIRGLTTAAGLWCSAAVGTMAGIGFGTHAAIGTAFVLALVLGLRPVARWIDARQAHAPDAPGHYKLRVVCQEREHAVVRAAVARHLGSAPGVVVTRIATEKPKRKKQAVVNVTAVATPADDRAIQDTIGRVLIEPGVRSASWEKLPPPPE